MRPQTVASAKIFGIAAALLGIVFSADPMVRGVLAGVAFVLAALLFRMAIVTARKPG